MAEHPGLLLVHDVLDAQLVDHREQRIGRVDELVLDVSANGAPCVSAILIGGAPRAQRIGQWAAGLRRAIRALARRDDGSASRVPFDCVRRIGNAIQIDVDGDTLAAAHLEVWLRDHVICRIPGAGGDAK